MPTEASTSRDASPRNNLCWQMPGDATEPPTPSDRSLQLPGNNQSPGRAQVSHACLAAVSGTFDSLSKVLCIFPSRYLFAIGLELVLSFRWNVPPNLRCRSRQHDSESTDRTQPLSDVRRDSHPLSHPLPRDLHLRGYWNHV